MFSINGDLGTTGDIGTIHIVLTNFCNQGCVGCYQSIQSRESTKNQNNLELTQEIKRDIERLFNEFKNLNKQIKISFFGGEPLLRIDTIIQIMNWLYIKNLIPKYVNIPTSGGRNQNLINDKLKEFLGLSQIFTKTKFTISLSYDGPNNLNLRNSSPEQIKESIDSIDSYSLYNYGHTKGFKPEFTSCLIPQIIDEDYFIDTTNDVLRVTGILPNFRIPHIIESNSNIQGQMLVTAIRKYFKSILESNFIVANSPMYRKMNLVKFAQAENPRQLPKLFGDIVNQICKPKDYRFLWCQAGESHLTITNKGIHPNSCEYLNVPARDLQGKMISWCFNCEINTWCHRPCLKSFELMDTNPEQLDSQCKIRKIIFNEIKNILLED